MTADIGVAIALQGQQAYIAGINKVSSTTATEMGRVDKSFSKTGKGLQSLTSQVPGLGSVLAVVTNPIFAIGAAVTGLTVGFKKAVNTAKVFQQQLADTAAIANISKASKEYADLTALARQLGATTEFTATQSAQAFEELARAGANVNEIMAAAPGTLALATVGNLDLAKAADIATNILGQYGKGFDELGGVVDVLAKTTTSSNTNITQLADAFNYLGPTAKALGISLEESAAAVGTLANSGLKGSLATRALGTALVSLTAPAKKARKEIDKIALKAFDSKGNFAGLSNVIGQLEEAYKGYTSEQKQASIAAIFGKESVQEINILLAKGSGELSKYTAEIKAAGDQQGAFSEAIRATKLDTFEGSLKLLSSAWQELQLSLSSGSLGFLSGAVTNLANGIRGIAKVITGEANFGDLLGPVGAQLDSIGQTIKGIFNDIIDATAPLRKTLSETFGDGAGVLQAVFLPAVSALGFALKGIAIIVKPVVAAFSSFLNEIIPPLAKAFDSVKQSISSVVTTLKSALAPVLGENGRLLEAFRKAAVTPLTIGLKALALVIRGLAKVVEVAFKVMAISVKALVSVFNIFKNGVKVVFEAASRIIDTFLSGISERFSAAGELFRGLFELDFSKIQKGAANLTAAFDRPLLDIRKNFGDAVNNVVNKNKIARDLQEAYEKGFSSFGAGSFNVFSESERAHLIDDMQGAIGSGVYIDPADARAAFDAIPTAAKDAFGKAGKEGEAFQQKLGSISAKAAVGSVSALNSQITALNDQLSKAAPTANIGSINQQVKGLNLALEQVNLRNLGINVDFTSSVDTSAFNASIRSVTTCICASVPPVLPRMFSSISFSAISCESPNSLL